MLFHLMQWISVQYPLFQTVAHPFFRVIAALLTALSITLCCGQPFIRWCQQQQIGQVVRDDGPTSHFSKRNTPTMGGLLLLFSTGSASLLWSDCSNPYLWVLLSVLFSFGFLGFVDDYKKLLQKNSKGLLARHKYLVQSLLAIVFATITLYMGSSSDATTQLVLPGWSQLLPQLGYWYLPFTYCVVVGTSNAVNLTDGLDGLAIFPAVLIAAALGWVAWIMGDSSLAELFKLPYISYATELTIFCSALAGAGLGFLWFNSYPAQLFMGDVGALPLGASLAAVAVLIRQELLLFIMGGLFVMEALSVMLQVIGFKLNRKRLFRMAPIHHHFELKGWPEPRIVVRSWILTLLLIVLGVAAVKGGH